MKYLPAGFKKNTRTRLNLSCWFCAALLTAICGCQTVATQQGANNTEQSAFKIEETRLGPYDSDVQSPVFSRDGQHLAYFTRRDQKWVVVVDGQTGPEYDDVSENNPIFSPDGKRLAYAAQKGQKHLVVVDGQKGTEYDEYGEGSLIFSPDGKHVAYGAQKGQKWAVVADGQASTEYDQFIKGSTILSTDGVLEYLAVKEGSLYRVKCIPTP